jgi:hypothetical protein
MILFPITSFVYYKGYGKTTKSPLKERDTMEEEARPTALTRPTDSMDVDNHYEEEREEAKTFDGTRLGQRRCALCHTPLTSRDFHGFNVLYCTEHDKPVCRICRHPSIELDGANAIRCTNDKCPTYQVPKP